MNRQRSQTETDETDAQHRLSEHEESAAQEQAQTGAAAQSPPRKDPSEAERQALLDRLARLQAEFENARKRMTREQQEVKDFAIADAVKLLLPVLDSFDLALHGPPHKVEDLRSGMDLIQRQLRDTLAKLGVQPVAAKGERFNPHFHEAVEVVNRPDAGDEQIVEELRGGYRLGNRLLRPAMVVVARRPDK